MSDLIYRTSLSEPGPWLLGEDELIALDAVLDEQWKLLNLAREKWLQQDIESKTQEFIALLGKHRDLKEGEAESHRTNVEKEVRKWDRRERIVTIVFQDGSKLPVNSFSEAMQHPQVLREAPTGFHVSIRCGDVSCTVSPAGRDLDVEVSPQNSTLAWDLFIALRSWVRSVKPPAWQQWWTRLAWALPVLWIIWGILTLEILTISSDLAGKAQYQRQAEELLKKGVSSNEQTKAIELILAFSANRFPQGQPWRLPGSFWFFLVGGTFSLLALSFRPNVVLGIGKGEARLRHWRQYMRVVFYTIPTYLLGTFAWPYLAAAIKRIAGVAP
jgi:hypothetical protein